MCKVSRGSEDHLVQGLADFGSFSQKMPLNHSLIFKSIYQIYIMSPSAVHYSDVKWKSTSTDVFDFPFCLY